MDDEQMAPGAPGYRALGLIGNPFLTDVDIRGTGSPLALEVHAAVLRLLGRMDESASGEKTKAVWVEKSSRIPTFYYLKCLSSLLKNLTGNEDLGFLAGYLPLDNLRIGRIRSALSSVAEHLTGEAFDKTLAAYIVEVLREPDRELPEFEPLSELDLDALAKRLVEDPVGTMEELFGPNVDERDESTTIPQLVMTASSRQMRLETEPEEDESSQEAVTDDPLADAFLTRAEGPAAAGEEGAASEDGEGADGAAQAGAEDGGEEGDDVSQPLLDYVEAHARTHLSPVLARGIKAYAVHGRVAAGQELKVTKAPRKTLTALTRFARYRYRKTCLVYDRFDPWQRMDDELRAKIIAALSELRFRMQENLMLVLLVAEDQAPELEEQFAAALRVDWSLEALPSLEESEDDFREDAVDRWLASAALHRREAMKLRGSGLERLAEASGGSLQTFARMAAAAIEDAARRDASSIDEKALEAGLALKEAS